MNKLTIYAVALPLVAFFAAPMVSSAQSLTVAQLQAEITSLTAEVQSLEQQLAVAEGNSTASWCYTFNTNLYVGMSGSAVTALQTALQKDGESVNITGTFNDQTASAVTGFQQKYANQVLAPYGLQNGTGYAGKTTRAELNSLFGCNSITPTPIPNPTPVPIPTPVPPTTPTPVIPPSSGLGALNIVLDPTIAEQSQSVTPGGTGYVLLAADLTAGTVPVTISSLNFGCGGFACNAVTNLTMVGISPNTQTWSGSASNQNTFNPNLVIPAGTTQVVELVGNVSSNAPAGQQLSFSLNYLSLNLAGGGTVTGSAFGNVLTVAGSTSAPSVSMQINGSNGPLAVSSGAPLAITWNSSGIPVTCTVAFNPTGAGTYNIAEGLSGSTSVSAPTVSVPSAFAYEVACPESGSGGASIADTVQVNVTPTSGSQATFNASPTTIASGNSTTFSWTNASAASGLTNFFGTASCVSGITMYDVTNNQSFLCGDVDRSVQTSGSDVVSFTSANSSATQVPFVLDYGNGQSLNQTITVSPPVVSAQPSVSVWPTTFDFPITHGQSLANYPSNTATFTVSPNQSVNWTWSSSASWINVTASNSTAQNGSVVNIGLAPAAANLAAGGYSGTVTISPVSGASQTFSPITIMVNLTVSAGTTSSGSPITITAPASGETLAQGSQYTIKWTTANPGPATVSPNLLQGSNYLTQIASNISNNGSYVWTVPSNYSGSGFEIYIASVGYLPATSNVFSIIVPTSTPSIPVTTATAVGATTGRMKSPTDILGVLSLAANGSGGADVNKITVTFGGSVLTAGGSTFLNSVQLLDLHNVSVISDGATVSVNPTAGTVTWTFGAGMAGYFIPSGTAFPFSLVVNSVAVPPLGSNIAESLSATIQNASDIQYSDSSATGLGLPQTSVPLMINSVNYAVGI